MRRVLTAIAGILSVWTASVSAQQADQADVAKGRQIATQVCAACHAPDGNSVAAVNPRLAGQIADYVHRQLSNFKSEGGKKALRQNPIMGGMVAGLSDADMRNVAAYYASQTPKSAGARDAALAEQGRKIYRGGNMATGLPACAGCHGPAAAGIPAQYPRLAGQFPEYIESQLVAFRTGTRANDPSGMMRGVAAKMSDSEIRAVAEFAASLR